ncbi:hypothetical protein NQ318_018357 [Aromia moschata]|uniref:Uncharacterized protein n=1 Tax=Aromia moschata TaxID=1265417 RepID=A0AAV8ZG39_9CUCU|nr:hypothetical protein NQ318_018357 [Aromia moschata]
MVVFPPPIFPNSYYWRDWNGEIPSDALKAGRDSRGESYIAQVYTAGYGEFIGQIFEDQDEVYVNVANTATAVVTKSHIGLKILCSEQNDMEWIVSNITRTPEILDIQANHLIRGGVDTKNLPVYIGRYVDGQNVFVGSVHNPYNMYYVNVVGVGTYVQTYELLMLERQ